MLRNALEFRITHEELKAHFEARAKYHRQRAEQKTSVLPDAKRTAEVLNKNRSINNPKHAYSCEPEDTVKELEQDIRTHRTSALKFQWMAEHIAHDDQITTVDELNRYEFF